YSTGRRTTYAYDALGNRTRLVDATGTYSTTYDAKSRVSQTINPDLKRVTYGFDGLDRRTRLRDPDGGRFTYLYDAKHRLVGVATPQGKRTTFTFDTLDRLRQQKHGSGSLTTQTYDAANQLTVLSNATSMGAVVNRFTYTYDKAGNRTGVREASGDR